MTRLNLSKSCEEEVVRQLVELQRRSTDYVRRDGRLAEDELFYAEQNARLVKNAEAYYRSVFLEEVSSANCRPQGYHSWRGNLWHRCCSPGNEMRPLSAARYMEAGPHRSTKAMPSRCPGVERVVAIPATAIPSGFRPLGGIAVIANNTWAAEQGRRRFKVEWDYGPQRRS